MTIDQGIQLCEYNAKTNEILMKRYDDASGYTRSGNAEIRTMDAKTCEKRAEEHRQLAGWLRELKKLGDYKRLKEQEPCDDVVSRQAVKEHMIKYGFHSYFITVKEFVEDLPPVNPEPKTGHWISDAIQGEIDGQIVKAFICSECGAISVFRITGGKIVNGDLCPNCGAKMFEPQAEG